MLIKVDADLSSPTPFASICLHYKILFIVLLPYQHHYTRVFDNLVT